MRELFAQFITERRYLKNVTNKTVIWYQTGFQSFMRIVSVEQPAHAMRLRQVVGCDFNVSAYVAHPAPPPDPTARPIRHFSAVGV